MVSDIAAGGQGGLTDHSQAGGLTTEDFIAAEDGHLYFAADDASSGLELWQTDGSPIGTTLVKDINTSTRAASLQSITAFGANGFLFFADDGVHGTEPWITDGTAAGTLPLKTSGVEFPAQPNPTLLAVVGNKGFFT
jgi:ELWxxDGT repeat protein